MTGVGGKKGVPNLKMRAFNEELAQEIYREWLSGVSYDKLSEFYGWEPATIQLNFKRYGLPTDVERKVPPKPTPPSRVVVYAIKYSGDIEDVYDRVVTADLIDAVLDHLEHMAKHDPRRQGRYHVSTADTVMTALIGDWRKADGL
jgi:hypothetical protein